MVRLSSVAGRPHGKGNAGDCGNDERGGDGASRDNQPLVATGEFLDAVERRRGPGYDRFVIQMPLDVGRQILGRVIAAVAVLLKRTHDDPVEVALEERGESLGFGPAVFGDRREGLAESADAGCWAGGSSSRMMRQISS